MRITDAVKIASSIKFALLSAALLLAHVSLVRSRVADSPVSAAALSVHWQPQRLVNGSPILFRITSRNKLQSLTGTWLGHEVFFSFNAKTNLWYGFSGNSLETKPGMYTLQLIGTSQRGKDISYRQRVTVARAHYPKIAIAVAKQYTEPAPEQLQKIKEDKSVKEDRFKSVGLDREWSGRFLPPVEARVSDVFGTQRVINGKAQSTHKGLDYAVPSGTPVAALNSGTIILARSLFFEGNCVVIDHGQGLLTLYLHLSQFAVKEGDHVSRGQELGLSGGTGRATGAHLHIAVRWQGIYLNPATMLTLNLP